MLLFFDIITEIQLTSFPPLSSRGYPAWSFLVFLGSSWPMKTCPIHVIPDKSSNELVESFLSLLRTYSHLHIPLQSASWLSISNSHCLHPTSQCSVDPVWLAAFFLTTSLAVCTATYFSRLSPTQYSILNGQWLTASSIQSWKSLWSYHSSLSSPWPNGFLQEWSKPGSSVT